MTRLSRHLLLVAVCFLALSARTHAQNLFFQPPTYAGTGQTLTADFNGDGKLDLISADGTVQLGNGNGTFKTGTPWVTPVANITFIAVGDFNGDGKPDLLVPPVSTSPSPTTAYVLLGNGDGTFQPAIPTNLGYNSSLVTSSHNREFRCSWAITTAPSPLPSLFSAQVENFRRRL